MASVLSSPTNGVPWLVRADFSDQQAWEDVCRMVSCGAAGPDRDASVEFEILDDPELDGLTPTRLLQLGPDEFGVYFLVDRETLCHPERPLLAVDVLVAPGSAFRLVPAAVPLFGVATLSSEMDFDDFVRSVDPDGIFRSLDRLPRVSGPELDADRLLGNEPEHPSPGGRAEKVSRG